MLLRRKELIAGPSAIQSEMEGDRRTRIGHYNETYAIHSADQFSTESNEIFPGIQTQINKLIHTAFPALCFKQRCLVKAGAVWCGCKLQHAATSIVPCNKRLTPMP